MYKTKTQNYYFHDRGDMDEGKKVSPVHIFLVLQITTCY